MMSKAQRPTKIYTENEIKRILPSFDRKWLETTKAHLKKMVDGAFERLGCDMKFDVEIQENVISRNRFNEEDTSTRFLFTERTDKAWLLSGCASNEALLFCQNGDKFLRAELDSMSKRTSFSEMLIDENEAVLSK